MTGASGPTVSLVAAARPNFMKVKPILDALETRGAAVELVHTGQHYDATMSDVFFRDLGLREPDHHLGVGSGSHAEQTARLMIAYEALLERHPAEAVVVVGDVNSTLACALVAAKGGAIVAHVEAGLRSRDWSMPEEVNRVVTDRVSDLLFASTTGAAENLRAEGYREDQIYLVGNTMIDTLLANLDRARSRRPAEAFGLEVGGYGLVTLHRPSNVDDSKILEGLVGALSEIARKLPLLFAVHPRTRHAVAQLEPSPGLRVIEPQGYLSFLGLQAGAKIVLTDSGGIQEETTALGVPCLTLRTSTERPITVSEGTNQVVGVEPAVVVAAAKAVLARPPLARCPALWDGNAGDRIARSLLAALSGSDIRRPTETIDGDERIGPGGGTAKGEHV